MEEEAEMECEPLVRELRSCREYFERSTRCLVEEDSGFVPQDGMYTAAQQVAHVAQTIDWFMEGAFRPQGFDLDFPTLDAEVRKVQSLASAREWVARSFQRAVEKIGSKSMAEMETTLPEDSIMGGAPRLAIIGAIADHTAHHRGALTVYSRLLGKAPPMPYLEA